MKSKEKSAGNFNISQNHILLILMAVGAYYFSSINSKNQMTGEQQINLSISVERLTGVVERLQTDIIGLRSELNDRTENRYSVKDHNNYKTTVDQDLQRINAKLERLEMVDKTISEKLYDLGN
jgi:hypothetical protein